MAGSRTHAGWILGKKNQNTQLLFDKKCILGWIAMIFTSSFRNIINNLERFSFISAFLSQAFCLVVKLMWLFIQYSYPTIHLTTGNWSNCFFNYERILKFQKIEFKLHSAHILDSGEPPIDNKWQCFCEQAGYGLLLLSFFLSFLLSL